MSHLNSCRFFVLMSQMSALNFFPSFLQTMAREESSDKSAARKGFLHMFVSTQKKIVFIGRKVI